MNLDRWLLAQAKGVRRYLAASVVVGVAIAVAVVLQAFYLSRTVTAVLLEGAGTDGVRAPLAILLATIVARALLTWLRETLSSEVAARIKSSLRNRLLARLMELGPLYASTERTGELTNTLVEGVESLDAYYSQYIPSLVLAVLVPVTILAAVFPIDLLSGFVFLLTAPLIPIFMILIGKLAEALTRRQWKTLSLMSAHFLDVLQGLQTLKLFNRSKAQVETISRMTDRFRVTTLGVLRVAFLSALVLEITGSISTAIVAVEVGLRLLYSSISFEQAFFVLVLAPEFYLPLRTLGASFHAGMSGVAAGKRMREILDGETGRRGDGENRRGIHLPVSRSSIVFRGVSLSYSGAREALSGVSLELRPGEKVALVGPSGAGKSSIASLLLRFAVPDVGDVMVGGQPLWSLPDDWWREQVAWVPQAPYLFAGTIADNIRLGRPEATDEEVKNAARLASVDEFIANLQDGYETMIGERGARLSGGQAQRIALARAFLKDSPLLILDEPTSNLDPETEDAIHQAMDRLMEDRTSLVIAHRMGTVRNADRIAVLDDGRVAEVGTHDDLLASGGLYARLAAAHSGDSSASDLRGIEALAGRRDEDGSQHSELNRLKARFLESEDLPNAQPSALSPESYSTLDVFRRLLGLAAPFRWWMALAVLLGVATVWSGIGLIATASFLIASAALHPSVADLAVPIVGVRFFGISRGVFRYLERYVSHDVTFRLLGRIRVWFYESVERLPAGALMQERSGDLLNRVVADVETLQHFYVRVLAPPLVAIVAGAAIWLFVQQFDSGLALVVLAFLLTGGLVVPLLVQRLGGRSASQAAVVRSEMNVALVDGIQGMADLLAFGQADRLLRRVTDIGEQWRDIQRQATRIAALHGAAGVLLAGASSWAVLLFAIPLVQAGRLEGVLLPVLALAALASFEAVAPLPLAFQHLDSSIDAGRRLLEVIDRTSEKREPRSETVAGSASVSPANRGTQTARAPRPALLSVRDVHFRYGPGEPWVLDGVSFILEPGKRVALVGTSGAGKSTIANLLLRFWACEPGAVFLEGRDLAEWAAEEVRERVTMVPQRVYLFNATIRENLLLARPGATDDEIALAVRQAGLAEFVRKLPEGYETRTGEQGLQLSGGERQRIALARALLRNSRLLILDEPASNLDSITERAVMQSVLQGSRDRAILLITHRLAGLEALDEILVLHGGRIVERGSHQDLLRERGLYRRMWDLQRILLPA